MRTSLQKFVLGFAAISVFLNSPIFPAPFVASNAYAAPVASCLTGQLSSTLRGKSSLLGTVPFPSDRETALALINRLEKSVYKKAVLDMKPRVDQLSYSEREKLWRMANKVAWRHAEETSPRVPASRRITMNTNTRRKAHQKGGWDESPDPSPPFEIKQDDPRPQGMPTGVYQLSSGNHAYLYPSTQVLLKNKRPKAFEIVYEQQTKDGKWVTQTGGYAAPDSSRGWDGRFEYQPDGKGGYELIVTQGSMELPVNFRGSGEGARELPHVSQDNPTRSRHIYTPTKWIPATKGKRAQLVVRDQGSILNMQPSVERRWIEADEKTGKLLHAHGYGENFVPDPKDPRKMWVDKDGYTWRIFDMVTAETKIQRPDGSFYYIPTETRSVAYRMDPKNPSKRVPDGVLLPNGKPASEPVFLTHNHFPGTTTPIPATVRYAFNTKGHAVEKRILQSDGTVKIITEDVPQGEPAVLTEGFNLAPGTVRIGKNEYYVGTNSAGEYTSGGIPDQNEETKYGSYLWVRNKKDGPIGPYDPIMTDDGKDFHDMTRDLTQMYGLSWGVGRGQAFKDDVFDVVHENGRYWLKAHGVDVDLLAPELPQHGYPDKASQFADEYRRHQLTIPISFVEKNGKPTIQVDDPKVQKDLEEWRKRRAETN
ncbi:MAG: hypothetical protein ACJ763_17475 [Bdellovibrionia bacterium]